MKFGILFKFCILSWKTHKRQLQISILHGHQDRVGKYTLCSNVINSSEQRCNNIRDSRGVLVAY